MATATLATEAVITPAIAAGIGVWLDYRYGWSPWATIGGLAVGFAGGATFLRELIRRGSRSETPQEQTKE